MYDFCTYFDHRYLPQGLALYRSLERHCPSFRLWVLCMDGPCYHALCQLNLPSLRLISLDDFEMGDAELLRAKQNRSLVEYYFTCTPSLPLFILDRNPDVEIITYLDADLYFFDEPLSLYDEMADHSVAIIGHRFSPRVRDREWSGIYNVGWLSFRRDDQALACLRWWRERCLEWCYDRCEEGRFADQKYLDDWPARFQGVVVLRHLGANLAPWNMDSYKISTQEGRIWVDGQPLIFFHFHGLRRMGRGMYDASLIEYKVKPSHVIRQCIYAPYLRTLVEATNQVAPLLDRPKTGNQTIGLRLPQYSQVVRLWRLGKGILTGNYFFVMGRQVF